MPFSLFKFLFRYSALLYLDVKKCPAVGVLDRDVSFFLGGAHFYRLFDNNSFSDPIGWVFVNSYELLQRPLADELLNDKFAAVIRSVHIKPFVSSTLSIDYVPMIREQPFIWWYLVI
ncbi:hypothetical protein WS99_27350 [Burkholderia territorii]|nr:hypothetical protein WS99_27350 [Burkholderia territorii]